MGRGWSGSGRRDDHHWGDSTTTATLACDAPSVATTWAAPISPIWKVNGALVNPVEVAVTVPMDLVPAFDVTERVTVPTGKATPFTV